MDKIQNRPKSELPWEYIPTWQDYMEGPDQWHNRDYEYVIHACNAYPKLIKVVKALAAGWDMERHMEFSSEQTFPDINLKHWEAMPQVVKFLKDLGEWNQ